MDDATLERQALDKINQFYQLRRTVPDANLLARSFSVDIEKARVWIEKYLTTNGKQISDQNTVYIPKAPAGTDHPAKEKKTGFLQWVIDKASLGLAILFDLVINGIGFWIIGPDLILKIGMLCISSVIILFSVNAWVRRLFILWFMFASVTSFMDTSLFLAGTDLQSEITKEDPELATLTHQLSVSQAYLEALQAKQIEKGEGYKIQIDEATANRDKAKRDRDSYIASPKRDNGLSADKIFTAIPDAVMSGKWSRWIPLILSILIFPGLQLTIVSATGVKWRKNASSSSNG